MRAHAVFAVLVTTACGSGATIDAGGEDVDAGARPFIAEPVPVEAGEALPNLFGVSGSTTTGALVVGERGAIYRRVDRAWARETSTSTADLLDVWVAPRGPAWAVGAAGAIVRRDPAGAWRVERNPVRVDLLGVYGSADGRRVFAVGQNGTILRRGNMGWMQVNSGTQETLNDVWINAAGDRGVAVGNLGTIVRFDGNGWSRQRVTGLVSALQGVFGAGGATFAAGLDGTLLRTMGGPWNRIEGAPRVFLRDVFGLAEANLYLVGWGGTVAHTDGDRVELLPDPDPNGDHRLEGVWATGTSTSAMELYVVGVTGVVLVGPGAPFTPPVAADQ